MPQPILKQHCIQPLIRQVITTATAQLGIKCHSQLRQLPTAIDQTCQRIALNLIPPPTNLTAPPSPLPEEPSGYRRTTSPFLASLGVGAASLPGHTPPT